MVPGQIVTTFPRDASPSTRGLVCRVAAGLWHLGRILRLSSGVNLNFGSASFLLMPFQNRARALDQKYQIAASARFRSRHCFFSAAVGFGTRLHYGVPGCLLVGG